MAVIIFVTGPPGAGKTRLAKILANDLQIPLIAKDTIKEIMFDTLGWSDRETSKKYAKACFAILDSIIFEHITKDKPLIAEGSWQPKYSEKLFLRWKDEYQYTPLVIHLFADKQTILRRFEERSKMDRHPGHMDQYNSNELSKSLDSGAYDCMQLGGETIMVDTSDFSAVDYAQIKQKAISVLNNC